MEALPLVLAGAQLVSGVVGAQQQSASQAAQAQMLQLSAESNLVTAQMQRQQGEIEANRIRDQLMKTLAAQTARYAAAGIVLDGGTPATVAEETTRQADRETEIARTGAAFRSAQTGFEAAQQQARASLLQQQSEWSLFGGVLGSIGNAARTPGLGGAFTSLLS